MTSPSHSLLWSLLSTPAAIFLNMRLSGLSLKFFSPPDVESVIRDLALTIDASVPEMKQ